MYFTDSTSFGKLLEKFWSFECGRFLQILYITGVIKVIGAVVSEGLKCSNNTLQGLYDNLIEKQNCVDMKYYDRHFYINKINFFFERKTRNIIRLKYSKLTTNNTYLQTV